MKPKEKKDRTKILDARHNSTRRAESAAPFPHNYRRHPGLRKSNSPRPSLSLGSPPHPAAEMGMHSFLKNVLKFTNAVLLLLGLFMSLFSLYLLLRFKKEVKEKEATSPVYPPPPPLAPETIAPPPPDIPHVIASEPWCVVTPRALFLPVSSRLVTSRLLA